MNKDLRSNLEDETPNVLVENGSKKQGRGLLGLLLMVVLMAWMVPVKAQSPVVPDGIYYAHKGSGSSAWYLWPSVSYDDDNATYGTNTGNHFVTTYQGTSAPAYNGQNYPYEAHDNTYPRWVVKNLGDNIVQIINPKMNKYIIIRGQHLKVDGSTITFGDRDIWLADLTTENTNSSKFKLISGVNITVPDTYGSGSGYGFNTAAGDKNYISATSASTPVKTERNYRNSLIQLVSSGQNYTFTPALLTEPTISAVDPSTGRVTVTDVNGLPDGYNIRYTVSTDVTTPPAAPTANSSLMDPEGYLVTEVCIIKAVVERYGVVLTSVATSDILVPSILAPTVTVNCDNTFELSCSNNATAVIYYNLSTDGTAPADPDATSTQYHEGAPVSFGLNYYLKAISIVGTVSSEVTPHQFTQVYTEAPSITLSTTTATITATAGATIYYTTDSTEPTTSSSIYSGPITISEGSDLDIRAIAQSLGEQVSCVTRVSRPAEPTLTITDGDCTTTTTANLVILTAPNDGRTLWYTYTAGNNSAAPDPSTTSYLQYTEPIFLSDLDGSNTYYTIHAYAQSSDGLNNSDIVSESHQMKTTGEPELTPPSGSNPVVGISGGVFGDVAVCTVGSNTTNVDIESDGTAEYTIPSGASGTLTVAFKHGNWLVSCEATYTIPTPPETPTWSQTCDNLLSLSTTSPMAVIHYTTDGTEALVTSPTYTEGCLYNIAPNTRVRAKAFEGFLSSEELDFTYQPSHVVVPSFFVNGTQVTISGPSGATVYYTYNVGSAPRVVPDDPADPTSSSTQVTGPITIAGDNYITVFKAIAIPSDPDQASCVVRVVTREGYSINTTANLSLLSTYPDKYFFLFEDIDASGFTGTVNNFSGVLDGNYHTISNLSVPLFNTISGADATNNAAVLNVMFKDVKITTNGNAGAIANTATGYTRIYNCGILPDNANGTTTSYISGTANVGGLVGELSGTARVINCFSYANITGGNYRGGIVGNNNVATASQNVTDGVNTMIMNCMFYGNITSGGTVIAPVYGGTKINNSGKSTINGLNNYNYFRFNKDYVANNLITDYNCALAAQDRYLVRFEFFRNILNSNRELAMWYVSGSVAAAATEMGHWVLDKSVAPYPILKEPGQAYPSLINPDAAHAIPIDPDNEHRNEGRKLGVLRVNVNNSNTTTGGATAPSTINIAQSLDINIIDKDVDNYNFNYYKIQLPYYNEIVGANGATNNNYTGNKVVTGWKITGFVGGTPGSFTTGVDVVFNAQGNIESTPYNFVDRACTDKDKYSVTHRVFNQGAYYEVPDGVTGITIEPYWANCVYLSDANYDVTYDDQTPTNVTLMGNRPSTIANNSTNNTIYHDFSTALNNLNPAESATVYDYAIVLVGNYHKSFGTAAPANNNKPFTIMSADMDNDNEPDNSFFYHHDDRRGVSPIRFDFINVPGIGMAQKEDNTNGDFQPGIFQPRGWFEITNTVLIYFGQFEYADGKFSTKDGPVILQGGIYEQFVSARNNAVTDHLKYLLIGGNSWFKNCAFGCHSSGTLQTKMVPVSVAGGDYEHFYLTGIYSANINPDDQNVECYIDGGRFGEVAGAGQQRVDGSVTWLINAADITSFFGGGINYNSIVSDNIYTQISNSHVNEYCGGPKFGNMNAGKTVTNIVTNCDINTFFGAGYGGTALNRIGIKDYTYQGVDFSGWNGWVNTYYLRKYQTSQAIDINNQPPTVDVNAVSTNYEYEYMFYSGGTGIKKVARFYVNFASLSLANTKDVSSTLNGCRLGNFYGGGKLGAVDGDAVSILTDCTVEGNVYGSGFSAEVPTVDVISREKGNGSTEIGFRVRPEYNNTANTFNTELVQYGDTVTYTWTDNASLFTLTGNNPQYFYDNGDTHLIYTNQPLNNLGTVSGNATLTINGNSVVKGDVYGGGALSSSGVGTSGGKVQVNIDGGTYGVVNGRTVTGGNIYGGGMGDVASLGEGHSDMAVTEDQVEVNIGNASQNANNVVINGSVYGGNNINGTPKNDVVVHIYKTKHNSSNMASNIGGSHAIKEVFGGGNKAHYQPTSENKKTTVHVHYCDNTIEYVYGGGNAADVGVSGTGIKSATDVIIDGGRILWVFGGGNGYSETNNHTNYYLPDGVTPDPNYNPGANVFGNVNATFHAGHVTYFFGGSNEWGEIEGEKNINILNDGTCSVPENRIVELYGGNNKAPINNNVGINFTMPCSDDPCPIDYLFGGSRMADISGDVVLNLNGGLYNYVFGGNNISGEITGNVTLNLFGGTINEGAFGGNNEGGDIKGKITVNMLDQGECPLVVHNIYGGGYNAAYSPTTTGAYPEVNLIHGTVSKKSNGTDGNVYGGGYGSPATVTSNPVVKVGYDASMASLVSGLLPPNTLLAASNVNVAGNVYGGGNLAPVSGYTSVTMQQAANTNDFTASSIVSGDIYGGGNLANVTGSTVVNVTGGTVSQDVYGGGAFANVGTNSSDNTTVTLAGGTVRDIYGGGLGDNTHPAVVKGAVQVTVNNGTIRDVFGCNNVKGAPQSTVQVNINNNVGRNVYGGGNLANCEVSPIVYINNGTVGGNVFGGGLGSTAKVINGQPSVTIGTSNSSDGYKAIVMGDVYGGGDMADVKGKTTVLVQKCNTVINGDVYGGGNAAHVLKDETDHFGTTNVTVTGGTIDNTEHTNAVYGGGHGDKDATSPVAANVATSTNVTINGGTINQVYGGSNSLGTINNGSTGGINVLVEKASGACDLHINEVYGGGNYAASQAGSIDIRCTGTGANEGITYVYGGANRADVTGPIELTISEGRIANVFGGNNNSGEITGAITVNINKKTNPNPCIWAIGNVYGGGNQALYGTSGNDYPEVNIINGLVSGDVFGGGLGSTGDAGKVTGNPHVKVNGANASVAGGVYGGGSLAPTAGNPVVTFTQGTLINVFGGGLGSTDDANAGKVTGNPQVTVNGENATVSGGVYGGGSLAPTVGDPVVTLSAGALTNVFGGGRAANVNGDPTVNIGGGTVSTGVYGGCHEKGNVGGNITVNVNGGTIGSEANLNNHITGDVFGGGYGGYDDESHPGTTTSGNVVVNINDGTIWGNVYGGSSFGDVNVAGKTTTVNIMGGMLKTSIEVGTTAVGLPCNIYHGGNVFGGGLGQKGATGVTAYAAKVYGAVTVNIGTGTLDNTAPGSDYNEVTGLGGSAIIEGNVYGCNNQNGSPQDNVVVNVFQTYHTDGTGGTVNNTVGGTAYALHDVFGGGNEADFTVSGKTATVNIYTCANTIERTFSGGNAAATNSVRTMIQGGRIREVYGGGNGEVSAADVNGTVTLDIHGGEIGQSYAGSNQQGTIAQGSTVNADDLGPCGGGTNVNEFFCGGNYANYIGDINATITCNGRMVVDNLYGGCNQAHVVHKGTPGQPDYEPGNITLTVYGGTYKNIYGGSKGTPTKGADVEGSIILNIHGGTITEAIFGGSNIKGAIGGTITVNVEDKVTTDQCPLDVSIADVYGGGNMADYPGVPAADSPITAPINHPDNYNYPMINIKNATVKNVYGGGLKAEVKGNPQIKIKKGSRVLGNVYGGGNMGEVIGDPRVIINGKDNSPNPTGL